MRINWVLTILAVVYTIINLLFYWHLTTMPNATSMIYVIIYPLFWIATIIAVTILAILYRKKWFNAAYRLSTIVILLFCTPIPLLGIISTLPSSDTYCVMTGYDPKNGYTFKQEEWIYRNGRKAIYKYFKADGEAGNDDTKFKKDSTWVYFDKSGDTSKTETYRNGILISAKKYK